MIDGRNQPPWCLQRGQDDGRSANGLRVCSRLFDGPAERAAPDMRHIAAERPGKFVSCRADAISLADFREVGCQRLDAAFLRLAAENPENTVEGLQRLLGGIRIGGLRIVDEEGVADAADLLHAMRQTGEEMSVKYKETSLGGLAVNLPEC